MSSVVDIAQSAVAWINAHRHLLNAGLRKLQTAVIVRLLAHFVQAKSVDAQIVGKQWQCLKSL
ncbi:hypothetical protein D3C72_2409120 [compost metagenome]